MKKSGIFKQKYFLNTTLKYFIPFRIHTGACAGIVELVVTRGLDPTNRF